MGAVLLALPMHGVLWAQGDAKSLDEQGMAQMRDGKFFAAQELFEQALRAGLPDDAAKAMVEAHLGESLAAQRLYDDAIRAFESALALDAGNREAQAGEVRSIVQSALALRAAGDRDGALAKLVEGRKAVPASVELMLDFGIQAEEMRIYKDADAALAQAHTLEPANLTVLYALARVELDEQKMPQAETHFREYLKAKPEDASAHYGLGHLLHMEIKDDEAKVELERSVTLQPRQTEAYYQLGEIALAMHQDAEAKADYEKVLAEDPHHGGAVTGMGILAFRAKDNAAAEKYLKQAVVDASDYPTAHRYYAMLLDRLGEHTQAEQEMTLARQLTEEQNRLAHGYEIQSPQ
ncbi:hypothetical protein GCM10011586_01490 [Silvibacterium dinghuense]|nr:hypothetical protein GCM10011586_01490 [Silvibacterium dinghuense]